MEKDDNDDSPLMDKAIVILQDRWKKILEHWRTTGERPLSPNERLELKSNIHLLQKQLKALLSVKGLLEEMVEYEKELSQLLKHKDEKNTIKAKLDALFSERVTIFDEMREMRIDESFLAAYFERSGDYRDQSPLPLPPGFMSHEEYAAELKFLKASIHFEEIGAKNDLLQSFCDLHASAKDKTMHDLLVDSINKGLDRSKLFKKRLFCLLHETRPLHAEFFHTRCKALLQRWMDNMETTRLMEMKLEEFHEQQ